MQIRTITPADYEKLFLFWKENYFVSEMDNAERFILFLEMNPDLSVLAEENNEIIGTALGSYDGRRGYLQKVVTQKTSRHTGIGKQLVTEVINRLKAHGVLYIPISVEPEVVAFYEKCGFSVKDSTSMAIEVK